MLEFVNLIKITGNQFWIRGDDLNDLLNLYNIRYTSVNTTFIIQVKLGSDFYFLDLSKMLLKHTELLVSENAEDLVSKITHEMIFAYQTNIFSHDKTIRSFTNGDVPGEVKVSPYNATTNEFTNVIDDPSFRDMAITCNQYNFTKVIPIIQGKVKYCGWNGEKIFIKEAIDLVKDTKEITFMSLGECNFSLMSLNDVLTNNGLIGEGIVPILVLGGSIYVDTPWLYNFNRSNSTIRINEKFAIAEFFKRGYQNFDEIVNDKDSFIIAIEANNVFVRDIPLIKLNDRPLNEFAKDDGWCGPFMYNESSTWKHHTDYICIDAHDYTIRGMVSVDEQYQNVSSKETAMDHFLYVHGGSPDMRLVQMVIN